MGEQASTGGSRHPVVLVGVDGSELSESALRRTVPVAGAIGAEVVVVFVRQIPNLAVTRFSGDALGVLQDGLDELEEQTRDEVERTLGGSLLRWRFLVREGDPAHTLLDVAHEEQAACVVVGANIHGALSSMVLSSVAAHLLHHCDVSVVIVRPERLRDGGGTDPV